MAVRVQAETANPSRWDCWLARPLAQPCGRRLAPWWFGVCPKDAWALALISCHEFGH